MTRQHIKVAVDIDEWECNEAADIAVLPLSINYREFDVFFNWS